VTLVDSAVLDELLDVLLGMALRLEVESVELRIVRDAGDEPVGASASFCRDGVLFDAVLLPVRVIRALVGHVVGAAEPIPEGHAWRPQRLTFASHELELELPHPEDTQPFDARLRLRTAPSVVPSMAELSRRLAELIDRLPRPEGGGDVPRVPSSHALGDELLAGVLEGRPAALHVYADWLTESGDPRGERLLRSTDADLVRCWLGAVAELVGAAELDDAMGADVVIERTSDSDTDWERILAERHWRVVRLLWLRGDIPASRALTLLRDAPLSALRHLVLEDDGLITSASRATCASHLETLGIAGGYGIRLAELDRALGSGAFPKLERCVLVLPPRGDEVIELPREPFRYADRSIALVALHAPTTEPLALARRIRGQPT
jgi:hypothetical protein